jgi:GTP-binding protein HflX
MSNKGAGEKKLELDRRRINHRITELNRELKSVETERSTQRKQRQASGIPLVSLVGYTNAGKSTLLNALTGAGVLSEDKLFATLDPTTRKLALPGGESVLLTDTVGFIRKLPHHLVKAFKSTLDEVAYADILLIVSDSSDPELAEHIDVTKTVIEELGASDKEIIYVYNKCDLIQGRSIGPDSDNSVMVSGATGDGLEDLLCAIERAILKFKRKYKLVIPYSDQSVLSYLYDNYAVEDVEYIDVGISVTATLDERGRGVVGKYISED